MRIRTTLLAAIAAVVLAGCTDSGNPGIATAGGATAAPTGAANQLSEAERAAKFGKCMRDNGVPEFPDAIVNDNGGVSIDVPPGTDPAKVEEAMGKCREFTPNGGEPRKLDPERLEQLRKVSQCMRENGVPTFPDPTDEGIQVDGNKAEFDPSSPTFQKANEICNKYAPTPPPGEGPSLQSRP